MTYYSGQKDLEYYPSGTIKSYVTLVSDEFQVGSQFIKVAERTKISFYPNGNIKSVFLADDTELMSGKKALWFQENDRVDFLEDGNLNLESSDPSITKLKEDSVGLVSAALKFFGI